MKTRRIVSLWLTYALLAPLGTASAIAAEVPATDIQLYCAPVLQAGAQTELTALTRDGQPLAGITIKVNDVSVESDEAGHARFLVPDSKELSIGLQKQSGMSASYSYSRSGNLLVQQTVTGQLVASLYQNLSDQKRTTPRLLWAPATLQQGQEFVIGGVKLGSNSTDFKVIIDGSESTTLACSPASIIARAPGKLSAAPLRELFVSCGPSNTNAVETDICDLTLTYPEKPEKDGSPQQAKLVSAGTNMPCLVRVTNNTPDIASVWLPDQKPMGKQGLFLTPGGADNSIAFQIKRTSSATPALTANLVSEISAGSQKNDVGFVSMQTRKDLCLAQITRLQRRYIAVQTKLEETRKQLEKAETGSESTSSQLQFLSLRQNRLQAMLEARRALLQVLGGTEEAYRAALGKATGTATLPLELSLQVSGSGDVHATAMAIQTDTAATRDPVIGKPKPRLHRNIAPSIKLLPPMDENDPRANRSSAAAETAPSPYTDGPEGLRPSLPEDPKQSEKTIQSATSSPVTSSEEKPTQPPPSKKPAPDAKAKTTKQEAKPAQKPAPKSAAAKKGNKNIGGSKRRSQATSTKKTARAGRRSRRGR